MNSVSHVHTMRGIVQKRPDERLKLQAMTRKRGIRFGLTSGVRLDIDIVFSYCR